MKLQVTELRIERSGLVVSGNRYKRPLRFKELSDSYSYQTVAHRIQVAATLIKKKKKTNMKYIYIFFYIY